MHATGAAQHFYCARDWQAHRQRPRAGKRFTVSDGKPGMAEGGGTEPEKLSDAIEASYSVIERMLQ